MPLRRSATNSLALIFFFGDSISHPSITVEDDCRTDSTFYLDFINTYTEHKAKFFIGPAMRDLHVGAQGFKGESEIVFIGLTRHSFTVGVTGLEAVSCVEEKGIEARGNTPGFNVVFDRDGFAISKGFEALIIPLIVFEVRFPSMVAVEEDIGIGGRDGKGFASFVFLGRLDTVLVRENERIGTGL
jgi:hypothetical protein